MAKRGADNQLTKDDHDSDGEDPGQREEALRPIAGRQIRGLPKRKGAAPAEAAPGAPAPPASGFSFGASSAPSASSSSSPFSFGTSNGGAGGSGFSFGAKPPAPAAPPAAAAPAPAFGGFSFSKPATPAAEPPKAAAAAPPPAFGGFSFGKAPAAAPAPVAAAPAAPSAPSFTFGKKPAEVAPIAPTKEAEPAPTAAAPPKPFGGFSFGGSAVQPAAPAPAQSAPATSFSTLPTVRPTSSGNPKSPIAPAAPAFRSSSGPGPSQATPPDEGEVAYYTALRGLNNAFLSFVSHELNSNEFLNLTKALPGLLSQYEAHLNAAASKAGWKPKADAEKTNGAVAAAPAVPAPASAPPAAGGFSFGQSTAPSSAPVAAAAKPAFSFGGPTATEAPKKTSSAANQLAADILAEDEAARKPKEPEAPAAAPPTPSKAGALFSFAPSAPLAPTTPGSKTFAPSASTTSAGEPPAKLGKFGPDGTNPQLSFGGAKATPSSTAATSPPTKGGFSFGSPAGASAGFSFGGSSSSSSTPAAVTKSPPKAAAFSFGSNATAGGSSAFSFGGSGSAAPAPAGGAKPFAFTQTLSTPAAAPFSFGGASSSSSAPTPGADTAVPATAAEPIEVTKNLAQAVGEGEEDEDTVAEVRGKLSKLEDGKWAVVGLGQFKLKRNKTTDKRRLLMRADGGGSVILNMAVGESLDPKADGNNIRFLGFDVAGSMKPFVLRVKTADAAATLVAAIKKEVEALKA
ncbi:hypothetical protein Q8F55_001408 [Vanrija albida]|uniref:RanBD1 domain-containing protein n=1 Tax=Vanrija albida TaxID=181172 RepID=A0ABR3QG48_9TREE